MKEKIDINRIAALLSISGLVLLLLLSPCNVRKHLQAELGMTQTEVSNKSKASVGTSNCNSQEVSDVAVTISKPSEISVVSFAAINNELAMNTSDIYQPSDHPYYSREQVGSFVPYYILYKNFKGNL